MNLSHKRIVDINPDELKFLPIIFRQISAFQLRKDGKWPLLPSKRPMIPWHRIEDSTCNIAV
jgi:hypothetical protein